MLVDTRTLATLTMIAAPTLMFLAASAALVLVTGPSKAQEAGRRQVEIRGGETVEVAGPGGRILKLKFTRVIADGRCATARCERAGAPVVEVQAVGASTPSFRLSPAAHLGAPFVPVMGRFVTFGELSVPPRELTTGGRPVPLDAYVLKLTVTP